MDHSDHVRLIAPGVGAGSGGSWADLGAGTGAFTLALRDVAGPDVEIVAIDRDRNALGTLRAAVDRHFPGTHLRTQVADFTEPLALPALDGIVAANAIHYARDQVALLRRWRGYLKPGGRLIVVEYDTDAGNRWVPYAVSFVSLATVARSAGFEAPVLLGTVPSRFLGRMYAAGVVAP
ncbi:MAG TPA: class I SAM-dependent methyltransferase [Thermomicrobiales bacterium]|jgi:ubiquinone/menaquinone biosynthesis C-methylase UbiE